MTARRSSWSEWTVRLVALFFVVQGALLAFSQGASADTVRRDQFGNVLCLASADMGEDGHGSSSGDHLDKMACCTLSCGMFAGLVAPAPATAASGDAWVASRPPVFRSYADILSAVPETPRSTRGPPATA